MNKREISRYAENETVHIRHKGQESNIVRSYKKRNLT